MDEPTIELTLNTFDVHGHVTGTRTAHLTPAQIADVIDHAAQASVIRAAGLDSRRVLDEMDEALAAAGLEDLTETPVP